MKSGARILVYTAVIGKSDALRSPTLSLPMDKVCFTDMRFHGATGYELVQVELDYASPRKGQRRIKIFWPSIFDDYDYSLYLDSHAQLKADPAQFIDFLEEGSDILVFRHPARSCLYQEASFCVKHHRASRDNVARQLEKYRWVGCPEENGLYVGTFIFRRHTEEMRRFSRMWWEEVRDFSARDQISLPFVVWQQGIRVSIFPEGLHYKNPWFNRLSHDRAGALFGAWNEPE